MKSDSSDYDIFQRSPKATRKQEENRNFRNHGDEVIRWVLEGK